MKALVLVDLQQLAISNGGKCLNKEYLGRQAEHTWRCGNGHVFDLRPDFVKQGAWCRQCIMFDEKIEALELMQQWAKQRGGKCLSKTYVNTETKLLWECHNGHRFKKTRDVVKQQKNWCNQCVLNGIRKKNLKKVQQIAFKNKGKCLSANYTNLSTKLEFVCANNHEWKATPHIIIYDRAWCPYCYGNKLKTIGDMRKLAATKKGLCLSKKYVNTQSPLKWQCAKGHVWSTPPKNISSGTWCPQCSLVKRTGKR